jgi:hypothetical protein
MSAALRIAPPDGNEFLSIEAFRFGQERRSGSYLPLTRFETMPSKPCWQASL